LLAQLHQDLRKKVKNYFIQNTSAGTSNGKIKHLSLDPSDHKATNQFKLQQDLRKKFKKLKKFKTRHHYATFN
jgi:hypothetical protein